MRRTTSLLRGRECAAARFRLVKVKRWRQTARQYGHTAYHVVGTCKMGEDRAAVVDGELRVHGVAGLRVDASIMPTMTSGKTNAPVIMIAEKAADMIKAAAFQPARAA